MWTAPRSTPSATVNWACPYCMPRCWTAASVAWRSNRLSHLIARRWTTLLPAKSTNVMIPAAQPCAIFARHLLSQQSRNVLFFEGVVMLNGSPFPSASIVQNGARGQGFASPRNNRAPLTAPRRSKVVLRRGKGEVRKPWPIGHFYFAAIGHFYFAPTWGRLDTTLPRDHRYTRRHGHGAG